MNEPNVKERIRMTTLSHPRIVSDLVYDMALLIASEWKGDSKPDAAMKEFNEYYAQSSKYLSKMDRSTFDNVKRRKIPTITYKNETYCPTCKEWLPDNNFVFWPESTHPNMLRHPKCRNDVGIIKEHE